MRGRLLSPLCCHLPSEHFVLRVACGCWVTCVHPGDCFSLGVPSFPFRRVSSQGSLVGSGLPHAFMAALSLRSLHTVCALPLRTRNGPRLLEQFYANTAPHVEPCPPSTLGAYSQDTRDRSSRGVGCLERCTPPKVANRALSVFVAAFCGSPPQPQVEREVEGPGRRPFQGPISRPFQGSFPGPVEGAPPPRRQPRAAQVSCSSSLFVFRGYAYRRT